MTYEIRHRNPTEDDYAEYLPRKVFRLTENPDLEIILDKFILPPSEKIQMPPYARPLVTLFEEILKDRFGRSVDFVEDPRKPKNSQGKPIGFRIYSQEQFKKVVEYSYSSDVLFADLPQLSKPGIPIDEFVSKGIFIDNDPFIIASSVPLFTFPAELNTPLEAFAASYSAVELVRTLFLHTFGSLPQISPIKEGDEFYALALKKEGEIERRIVVLQDIYPIDDLTKREQIIREALSSPATEKRRQFLELV